MLNLFFLTIILYIIIKHLLDGCNELNIPNTINNKSNIEVKTPEIKLDNLPLENNTLEQREDSAQNKSGTVSINQLPSILKTAKIQNMLKNTNENFANENQQLQQPNQIEQKVWEFDRPNPWTRVIYHDKDEYPYHFHFKINIPSLNDFQTWKQIIPNLDFNPRTGELIIPSK